MRLGRKRQVWLIAIADERVGVQVKLRNPLRTRALYLSASAVVIHYEERKRRYIKCMHLCA